MARSWLKAVAVLIGVSGCSLAPRGPNVGAPAEGPVSISWESYSLIDDSVGIMIENGASVDVHTTPYSWSLVTFQDGQPSTVYQREFGPFVSPKPIVVRPGDSRRVDVGGLQHVLMSEDPIVVCIRVGFGDGSGSVELYSEPLPRTLRP